MSTSSSTSICLKLPITFTSFTNFAMAALWNQCWGAIRLLSRKRPFSSLGNSSMPFRCSINITLCTEIWSLIIFSLVTALLNWEISDSVKVWKKPTWQRLCWDRLFIWRHKSFEAKSIAQRRTFGRLELCCIRCCMDSVPLNQQPSPSWSKSSNRPSFSFQTRSRLVSSRRDWWSVSWPKTQLKELNGWNY
jgi:hypothetical protein